jgi:hypothetical protein
MTDRRRWWHRYLDLFVMEISRPDGSKYLMSINSTGFGECWMPIEIIEHESPLAVSENIS